MGTDIMVILTGIMVATVITAMPPPGAITVEAILAEAMVGVAIKHD